MKIDNLNLKLTQLNSRRIQATNAAIDLFEETLDKPHTTTDEMENALGKKIKAKTDVEYELKLRKVQN